MELPYRANKQNDEIVEEKIFKTSKAVEYSNSIKLLRIISYFILQGYIVNESVCGSANTVLIFIM